MGCPKCGRFGKLLIKKKDNGLEHCKNCNIIYSFSIRCSLGIDGDIDCYVNYCDIMVGSPKWNELISTIELPKDVKLIDWSTK